MTKNCVCMCRCIYIFVYIYAHTYMWVLYFYLPHNSIQLKGIRNLLDCIAFALAHDTLCMSWMSAVYFHQRMHLFILVLRQKNIGCSSVTSWEVLTKFSDKTSLKYEKSSKRRCGAGGSLLLGSYRTRKSNKLNRFWIFFFYHSSFTWVARRISCRMPLLRVGQSRS